jgi:hypothetical protein
MYHTLQEYEKFCITSFILVYRLCIKIYLNERPFEPRERDYALVGSFMCLIWIGFGVYSLYEVLKIYSSKLQHL